MNDDLAEFLWFAGMVAIIVGVIAGASMLADPYTASRIGDWLLGVLRPE